MKVEWQRKVLGRKPGEVEDLDEKKEPRLTSWLKSGLVTKQGDKLKISKPTAPGSDRPSVPANKKEG